MKIGIKTLMALAMGLMIAGSSVALAAETYEPEMAGTKKGAFVDGVGGCSGCGEKCTSDSDCGGAHAQCACPDCAYEPGSKPGYYCM